MFEDCEPYFFKERASDAKERIILCRVLVWFVRHLVDVSSLWGGGVTKHTGSPLKIHLQYLGIEIYFHSFSLNNILRYKNNLKSLTKINMFYYLSVFKKFF